MDDTEYDEQMTQIPMPETKSPAKKPKQKITDKQKAARLANLAKGRATRAANLKNKKNTVEYDIESEEDDYSDEDNEYVFSKRPKTPHVNIPNNKLTKRQRYDQHDSTSSNSKKEMAELRNMMAEMYRQQMKMAKKPKKDGGTKIVMVPPTPASTPTPSATNAYLDERTRQLMAMMGK